MPPLWIPDSPDHFDQSPIRQPERHPSLIDLDDDRQEDVVIVQSGPMQVVNDSLHKSSRTARSKKRKPNDESSIPVQTIAIEDDEDEEPALLDEKDCILLDITETQASRVPDQLSLVNSASSTTLSSWLIDDNECKGLVTNGTCVELVNGDFLLVDRIVEDWTTEVRFTGTRLMRTLKLESYMSNKRNEVVMMRDYLEGPDGSRQSKGPHIVTLAEVSHVRELVKTNAIFPTRSYRDKYTLDALRNQKDSWHERYSHLTCRWEFAKLWKPKKNQPSEFRIQSLTRIDCDDGAFIPAEDMKTAWRGETIKGGSSLEVERRPWQQPRTSASKGKPAGTRRPSTIEHAAGLMRFAEQSSPRSSISSSSNSGTPMTPELPMTPTRQTNQFSTRRLSHAVEHILLDESDGADQISPSAAKSLSLSSRHSISDRASVVASPAASVRTLSRPGTPSIGVQRYTFGDGFCGAGGMSRGAKAAGVRLHWAFDKDERASGAYVMNFPETWTYFEEVHSFLNIKDPKKVDIMHLSPPCQTFSPAHTITGKNDEDNEAALFSVGDLVRAAKPRLFSLEQTFGIMWENNKKFFNNLIRQLLDQGYSTRWGLVQCLDYGGPKRSRLIIFAACPGEKLPRFPRATHSLKGQVPGTRPFKTIRQSLEGITDFTPNHNFKEPFRHPKASFSPDQPLNITITCNGGIGNYHYSGLRPFTNREYASLSGFPVAHYFGDVGEIRLIGNAVPPPVSEALTTALIEALEKADGFEGRAARRRAEASRSERGSRSRTSFIMPQTPTRRRSDKGVLQSRSQDRPPSVVRRDCLHPSAAPVLDVTTPTRSPNMPRNTSTRVAVNLLDEPSLNERESSRKRKRSIILLD